MKTFPSYKYSKLTGKIKINFMINPDTRSHLGVEGHSVRANKLYISIKKIKIKVCAMILSLRYSQDEVN